MACATPGPTNLAKEATNEVEEENEVHTSTEGVSMQSKGGSSSFSRKDWKEVEDECGLMDVWKKDAQNKRSLTSALECLNHGESLLQKTYQLDEKRSQHIVDAIQMEAACDKLKEG